jgi:hypothetical protein
MDFGFELKREMLIVLGLVLLFFLLLLRWFFSGKEKEQKKPEGEDGQFKLDGSFHSFLMMFGPKTRRLVVKIICLPVLYVNRLMYYMGLYNKHGWWTEVCFLLNN